MIPTPIEPIPTASAPHMLADVNCPYCGTVNSYTLHFKTRNNYKPHVITCDLENGGCNGMFVVTKTTITVNHTTAKLQYEDHAK